MAAISLKIDVDNCGAFELDPEHREFRGVCRSFVEREALRMVGTAEREGRFPVRLWSMLARAGLLGLGHPEAYGGTGGGHLAIALLSEELARASGGMAITPLVSSYMAAPHLARFGTEKQKQRYLAPVLAGAMIAAIAITEPHAGSDMARIRTRAVRVDGGWRLSGSKMFITNGGLADVIVVVAVTDPQNPRHGMTTFLVEGGHEGLRIGTPLRKLGWHASDTRELAFDDCMVSDEAVIGEVGAGFSQVKATLQTERVSLAGMGVGLAEDALELALTHARERETFGQRLGRHQAIAHRLAEMATLLEAARLLTYRAAARCDAEHPESALSVAQAKLASARAANAIADTAVQVFGGYGFSEEYRVAMHYRDARILRIGGGSDEVQLDIMARLLSL